MFPIILVLQTFLISELTFSVLNFELQGNF